MAAFPLLLWFGREQWFFFDEWEMLANRDARELHDLFAPHNGHWVTIPVLLWRLNFRLFGLNSYLPYQMWAVLGHLAVVAVVWAATRRIGVRSWIATLTALPFVVFGSGALNILFAFQFSLTLSVACGIAHLLLVDHDGPLDRRDAAGLGIGAVGLMSSALAVPFTAGVGVTALVRRGWGVALLHTAPLALAFVGWWAVIGDDRDATGEYLIGADTLRFGGEMLRASFAALGQVPAVGVALAGLGILGLVDAAREVRQERARLAVPLGLLAAAVGFAAVTGAARVREFGVQSAGEERYVYVVAGTLLPLVALGGEALARRATLLGLLPAALLVVGVPGNVDRLADRNPLLLGQPDQVEAIAHSPWIDDVPGERRLLLQPWYPRLNPTVEFLRVTAARGRIPEPKGVPRSVLLWADGVLALRQRDDDPPRCQLRRSSELALRPGDALRFDGVLTVRVVRGGTRSDPIRFDDRFGPRIDVMAGPLEVELSGAFGQRPRACVQPRSLTP